MPSLKHFAKILSAFTSRLLPMNTLKNQNEKFNDTFTADIRYV